MLGSISILVFLSTCRSSYKLIQKYKQGRILAKVEAQIKIENQSIKTSQKLDETSQKLEQTQQVDTSLEYSNTGIEFHQYYHTLSLKKKSIRSKDIIS